VAITSKAYGLATKSAFSGEINYPAATVKAMLTTSSYVPDQDTHQYKSSVTNEISGTGYTAGGLTLTTKTLSYDATTNTLSLGCDDPTWTGATFTFRYMVFYVDTGTASTSPLLTYVDFGVDQSVAGATFTYDLPGGVFYQHTAAA
jgi:hypothetical protein